MIRLKETPVVYSESRVKQKTVIILFQATVMTKKVYKWSLNVSRRCPVLCIPKNGLGKEMEVPKNPWNLFSSHKVNRRGTAFK